MHTTVFADEAIEALDVRSQGVYVDATFGQGGHSMRIAEKGGRVYAIDLDPQLQPENDLITLLKGNFADIESLMKSQHISEVDGILFDFGLSMNQIAEGGKGLSYKNLDEPLDMRLSGEGTTAAEIINSYGTYELTEIFMKYAEDTNSAKYVRAIQAYQQKKSIKTVGDFLEALDQAFHNKPEDRRMYAPIFQALRIEVNKEYETIPNGLDGALKLLKKGGRMVTITFHSIEDRWVKRFIREHKHEVLDTRIQVGKKRPLRSFERSATLRVMKKI